MICILEDEVISVNYVMSDLHGCYDAYVEALEKIHFKEEDTLYILGDVIDRGKQSIELLQDMMCRPNVYPIIGNHEYMALTVLKKFCVEITKDNVENYLTEEDMCLYIDWVANGGNETLTSFLKLSLEQKEVIIDYLSEFSLYEEVEVHGKTFILVHAGLEPFDEKKDLESYDLSEMIFISPDYDKTYFKEKYLVTGHTPTITLNKGYIYTKNHHIAIDCGCVFGYRLGVYCLENGKTWYVENAT